jgi:DMSO/TMAO reductase YedYZ molybdopterin-dependent catalytic subunit
LPPSEEISGGFFFSHLFGLSKHMASGTLTISGEVERPLELRFADFQGIAEDFQIADVSQLDPKRQGAAVRLEGVLQLAGIKPTAKYLTLHASKDDFHASIPLDAVRERAVIIYRQGVGPLPGKAGGPVRFFIPDFAACHTDEIDECANVKFVDRIELTAERGMDNRPHDEREHAKLHRQYP